MKNIVKTIAAVMLLGVLAASCQKENNKDLPALPDMTERTVNYAVDGTMTSTTVHGTPGWTEFLTRLMDQVDAGHRVSLLHGSGASQSKETVVRYTPSRDSAMAWVDSMYTLGYDVAVWYDAERQSYVGVASMSTAPAPSDRQWPDGALLGRSDDYYYVWSEMDSVYVQEKQWDDTLLTVFFYNPTQGISTLPNGFNVVELVDGIGYHDLGTPPPTNSNDLYALMHNRGAVLSFRTMSRTQAIERLKQDNQIYSIGPAKTEYYVYCYPDLAITGLYTDDHLDGLLNNIEDTIYLMPILDSLNYILDYLRFDSVACQKYMFQAHGDHPLVDVVTAANIIQESGHVCAVWPEVRGYGEIHL